MSERIAVKGFVEASLKTECFLLINKNHNYNYDVDMLHCTNICITMHTYN